MWPPVRNHATGHVHPDRLLADQEEASRSQLSRCLPQACLGSVVALPGRAGRDPRPKQEVLASARDFLSQYHASLKQNAGELEIRWKQVQREVAATGVYELTEKELLFGAKLAWRNSVRCIGRIQWNKLKLFDFRNVKTTKEMFEALCTHIEFSTNNGNIRSAISIFPPRTPGKKDFRVWNPQLISYAGYQNTDGSIVGDPINVEITQVCCKLGWCGRGTQWDILPLVVSTAEEGPHYYELPPSLVLEVQLSHPTFDWFERLGLRWYGLPAVSGMLFDCAGLEFTAAPFNGWYMSTEIGCRDLCDSHRYNCLEMVGQGMEMDTSSPVNLWKDKALVEVNVAVLHSFQRRGVTIVDHHTASANFMKHLENEQRARGGCPADWVWIVPPMSGSLTPVFHQEMLMYQLKPAFEYQESAWKVCSWKGNAKRKNSLKCKKFTFKQVARVVLLTTKLNRSALFRRIKATVLYATETGKSEIFARKLAEIFNHGFNSKVYCMEDYNVNDLQQESLVLFVTSTFGNGDAPENGEAFFRNLESMRANQTLLSDFDEKLEMKKSSVMEILCANAQTDNINHGSQNTDEENTKINDNTERNDVVDNIINANLCNDSTNMDTSDYDSNTSSRVGLEMVNGNVNSVSKQFNLINYEQDNKKETENGYTKNITQNDCNNIKSETVNDLQKMQRNEDDVLNADEMKNNSESAILDILSEIKEYDKLKSQIGHIQTIKSNIVEALAQISSKPLQNVRYSVFALGSSVYPNFCAFGHNLDQLLARLGAKRLQKVGEGDEMKGQKIAFRKWASKVFPAACKEFKVEDNSQFIQDTFKSKLSVDTVRFVKTKQYQLDHALSKYHNRKVSACRVLRRTNLHSAEESRSTLLLELESGAELTYQPGDHVGVFPSNRKEIVDGILSRLTVRVDPDVPVQVQVLKTGVVKTWEPHETLPPCSLRNLLTWFLDITTPLAPIQLESLARIATDPEEQRRLKQLASDPGKYDAWRSWRFPNLLEVLLEFPSVRPTASLLVAHLNRLHPRFYSVSSSPRVYPRQVHLTVAVVKYATQGGEGPLHYGVCSNYLQDCMLGTNIHLFVRSAHNFSLPVNISQPVVMVGPGTGIAPFRGFWQHRMAQLLAMRDSGIQPGKMWLFFGCQRNTMDLYKEEKAAMLEKGVLDKVFLALSREPGVPKTYVQNLLLEQSSDIHRMLTQESGHFYVCGDCKMAEDVHQTVEAILMDRGNMTQIEVDKLMHNLKEEKRYHEDIFGITLHTTSRMKKASLTEKAIEIGGNFAA
ncbi:nitric oxide synthase-like protein [Bacillus rossius redtenbacheri]|uniref:nitric oxide synthase-like protein n=1 Tax=Bacillus rossius redtenbacheri TaxID=93214 RepID=UPI002FDEE415